MPMPDPDHPLSITPTRRRVRARFAGHIIADSEEALVVRQGGEPAWHFFPAGDVETSYLGRTGHVVRSQVAGDADTYTLTMEGEILEDVAMIHEDPSPVAESLRGRIGFDPRRVEVYEIEETDLERADSEHPPSRMTAI